MCYIHILFGHVYNVYNIHVAFAIVSVCANMAWRGNSDQTSQKQSASHMSRICAAKSLYTVDAEKNYNRNGHSDHWFAQDHHTHTYIITVYIYACIFGVFKKWSITTIQRCRVCFWMCFVTNTQWYHVLTSSPTWYPRLVFGLWNPTDSRSLFGMHKHKNNVEHMIPSITERIRQLLFFKQRIGVETMWKVNILDFILLCFIYP